MKDYETNIERIRIEGNDKLNALVDTINKSIENVINIHE